MFSRSSWSGRVLPPSCLAKCWFAGTEEMKQLARSVIARASVRRRYEFKGKLLFTTERPWILDCQSSIANGRIARCQLAIENCRFFVVSAVKDLFFYETDMYTGFRR